MAWSKQMRIIIVSLSSSDNSDLEDQVNTWFHARKRSELKKLVTAEVIREHKVSPLRQHSDSLQRLLNYLGQFPIDGKLIVEYGGAEGEWYTSRARVSDCRVELTRNEKRYPTEAEAIHAVFLQRLADVLGIDTDAI